MQGSDKASVSLGLVYRGELVSLMSFTKPRFSKKYEWELSRFASLPGVNVVGAASKLFSHFVRAHNPKSVVSYSDIAKTRGKVYETLGFELSHISTPNYIWTDFEQVLTRYQTQMKKEKQTMRDRGFVQILS